MKYNYQGKDISPEKLIDRVGIDIFEYAVQKTKGNGCMKFSIYIDEHKSGALIMEEDKHGEN